MKNTRIALLVLGGVSLVFAVTYYEASDYQIALFIISRLIIASAVAFLSYKYAIYLGRSGPVWGIGSFLFPFLGPIILAFMKDAKALAPPEVKSTVQPPISEPIVESPMSNIQIDIPAITCEHLSISLVESSRLGNAGAGGSSFQDAIQKMNNKKYDAAAGSFRSALNAGLDTLRQGYAHANLGEMYIRANNLEKALNEFSKVLNFKEALYESVHTAVQYLIIIYRELGKPEAVNTLEQLRYRTSSIIDYSLAPTTVDQVRQLTIKNKSRLLEQEGNSSAPEAENNMTKNWKEKDNCGTRQETSPDAVAFWLARNASQKFEPFILYTFDHEESARTALLETGVVHNAEDSGKLICTETLTFGYYRREDGKYEAILCGDDLAQELWVKTKECFLKHGGILNDEQEPMKRIAASGQKPAADIQKVKFLREDRTSAMGQTAIYRVHTATDAQSAKAFLEQNPVNQKFYYLVVETPEGNYCRDVAGIYKE